MAHELRTPITVISSHAQRLKAEASDNSKPAATLIAAESQRLAALLTVMLDFARVDAGRLTLVFEPLDPELLLLDAFERLQALSPEGALTLSIVLHPDRDAARTFRFSGSEAWSRRLSGVGV